MNRFARDRRGNVTVAAALMLPTLVGFGTLAVDVSNLYVNRTHLQTAADAAALAAAQLIANTDAASRAAVTLAAMNVPSHYGTVTTPADVTFGTYDATTRTFAPSSTNINAVRVVASRTAVRGNPPPTFLAELLGRRAQDLEATATALVSTRPNACVIALAPSGANAFSVNGAGRVRVPNCGIYVNSNDVQALRQQGSGRIEAKSIMVGGGYSGVNYSILPQTYQPPIVDPLNSVPEPVAPASCTYTNVTFSSGTNIPGGAVYCGAITFNANIRFNPGIHHFRNATIKVASGIQITSHNAMLHIGPGVVWDGSGSGFIQL